LATGATIPYRGTQVPLVVITAAARRAHVELREGSLVLAMPASLAPEKTEAGIESALVQWLRNEAVAAIEASVRHWARVMDLAPAAVFVRDQKRRWGSCAPDGTLRFNWRLVMAEPELLEFVVVHELAHMVHHNHSRDFWALVERYLTDYRDRRRRLRDSAAGLSVRLGALRGAGEEPPAD
jgi:predicted metal-dependent hydrolase